MTPTKIPEYGTLYKNIQTKSSHKLARIHKSSVVLLESHFPDTVELSIGDDEPTKHRR